MLRTGLLGLYCLCSVWAWDEEHLLDPSHSQSRANPSVDSVVYYFAYGCNMLERLIRIKCPDAAFYGAALLENHRLDFTMGVSWWKGAMATLCKDRESEVWGILWMIKVVDMDKLDEQEGVNAGLYHTEDVIVKFKGRRKIKATTYVQNHSPRKINRDDAYPPDRRPSLAYVKAMIMGALEGKIPNDYVKFLHTIRHNGKKASWELILKLNGSNSTEFLL